MQSPAKENSNKEFSAVVVVSPPSGTLTKPNANPMIENKVIVVSRENINRAIEIFGWRFKTSLPILKPIHCCINPNF